MDRINKSGGYMFVQQVQSWHKGVNGWEPTCDNAATCLVIYNAVRSIAMPAEGYRDRDEAFQEVVSLRVWCITTPLGFKLA
eukprot:4715820-Pyramimonas_sp.AAC.1